MRTCRWSDGGICLLDGLECVGDCEWFEAE
jgi:hypothetical protein